MSIVLSNVSKAKTFFYKRPLVKGMVAYATIWPTSCFIQQRMEGKRWGTYDWRRCIRYGIFAGLYVAPTLYGWVRLTSAMWPRTNFRSGLSKAFIDSATFGPFHLISFYIGISLLEFKTLGEAIAVCKEKFLPTFKVSVSIWPILHTLNFSLIPERNRLVFASICSLFWTIYLAHTEHMKRTRKASDVVVFSGTEIKI